VHNEYRTLFIKPDDDAGGPPKELLDALFFVDGDSYASWVGG
jgi:hypothetical protein